MSPTAHTLAVEASFQAFANCYLREVNPGAWSPAPAWQTTTAVTCTNGEIYVVELPLARQNTTLALGVKFRSLVGRHSLTQAYQRDALTGTWRRVDQFSATLLLIDELYAKEPESPRKLELIGRVVESHQVMQVFLDHWLQRPSTALDDTAPDAAQGTAQHTMEQPNAGQSFIASEQSTLLGHWLHPTPKSRQGIHNWQHAHYSPELGGRFQLHFFAAARKLVEQCSLLTTSAEQIARHVASQGPSVERYQELDAALGTNYCFLPLHPLQAQWLLHQGYVRELLANKRLVDLGPLGPHFTPTSSVRTLYCESLDFMVKVSMPVKITNSLRINLKSELGDSVWVSKLLRECGLTQKYPSLVPIEDPAYITLALPEREETGFELIFRSNPFRVTTEAQQAVYSVAALVQDPLPGQTYSQLALHVRSVAKQEACSLDRAGHSWFDAYWRCAIQPALELYDEFGISLEAHQQNVLLGFSNGYPTRCYYRDIQGLALAESARKPLLRRVPELERQPKVFEDDAIVRHGFGYYVFFNQLYSVVNRLALDGLCDEASTLRSVRHRLTTLRPRLRERGRAFIALMLEHATIPCKANLLTRIADMDELQSENELAVYVPVENHLCTLAANYPNVQE